MSLENVVILHESKTDAWRAHKDNDPPGCLYCGMLITKRRIEFDHFPIPKAFGGAQVASVCLTCHDMKDRFGMKSWPVSFVSALAKDHAVIGVVMDHIMSKDITRIVDAAQSWRTFWDDITTESRLTFAKSAAVAMMRFG